MLTGISPDENNDVWGMSLRPPIGLGRVFIGKPDDEADKEV